MNSSFSINDQISNALKNVTNIHQVEKKLVDILKERHEQNKKVGYVSGVVFSDGPDFLQRNIQRLDAYTIKLRKGLSFPLFSPVDVFYKGVFENLAETKLPYSERRPIFIGFWQSIMNCGFITDLFMTPRWEVSEGATDEHTIGKKLGITIHYVENDDSINSK